MKEKEDDEADHYNIYLILSHELLVLSAKRKEIWAILKVQAEK